MKGWSSAVDDIRSGRGVHSSPPIIVDRRRADLELPVPLVDRCWRLYSA